MLAQAQLPDLSQGVPDIPPSAFLGLLALGFLIGAIGKLYDSGLLIALGMILIVVAAIVLPFAAFLSGGVP